MSKKNSCKAGSRMRSISICAKKLFTKKSISNQIKRPASRMRFDFNFNFCLAPVAKTFCWSEGVRVMRCRRCTRRRQNCLYGLSKKHVSRRKKDIPIWRTLPGLKRATVFCVGVRRPACGLWYCIYCLCKNRRVGETFLSLMRARLLKPVSSTSPRFMSNLRSWVKPLHI